MGVFGKKQRTESTRAVTRRAMKEARLAEKRVGKKGSGPRSGKGQRGDTSLQGTLAQSQGEASEADPGGALQRMVESFRDIGLDGKMTFTSAQKMADRARKRHPKKPEKAIKRIIRTHRRGVTTGGFLTGLGGVFTLAVLLPVNIFEFYVQATRMVGAIAAVRGHDISDEEVRARVLAALVGEESDDILASVGLGPVAGTAARHVSKRLPASPSTAVARAIGGRAVRRFGLRTTRLFGKAIPGLGGVLGAWGDRRALTKIATTALEDFPQA